MTQHDFNTWVVLTVILFTCWLAIRTAKVLVLLVDGIQPGETRRKQIKILPKTWFILQASLSEDGEFVLQYGFGKPKR